MAPRSRLSLAKSAIVALFERSPQQVYRRKDLSALLTEHREVWNLPASTSTSKLIDYLLDKAELREITLSSEIYGSVTRYAWKEPSSYAVFLSIKPNSYLSHASAIFWHGLTDLIPEIVYVNSEQSPKPSAGRLSQESLSRAFSRRQRESKLSYTFDGHVALYLSGKHTGNLGVINGTGDNGMVVPVTDVERTLIDAVVRPAYSGGLENLLQAFSQARESVSVNRVRAYLKQLAHAYPYHQAIGFMMERTGYDASSLDRIRGLGIDYDFYLDYGIEDPLFDPNWRVYYPRWL